MENNLRFFAFACWRELCRVSVELEVEPMDCIHMENNILFPGAPADLGRGFPSGNSSRCLKSEFHLRTARPVHRRAIGDNQ